MGSLGRYGILVEVSFKVFPQPKAYTTLIVTYADPSACFQAITCLATMPFEMDGLDVESRENDHYQLVIRLGGLPEALPNRVTRLQRFLVEETAVVTTTELIDDSDYWQSVNAFTWANPTQSLVKAPLTPKQIPTLVETVQPTKYRYTVGRHVAWFAGCNVSVLDQQLTDLGLVGLQLWGKEGRPFLGLRQGIVLARRVKHALDPDGKFLGF